MLGLSDAAKRQALQLERFLQRAVNRVLIELLPVCITPETMWWLSEG